MLEFLKLFLATLLGGLMAFGGIWLAERFRRRARPEIFAEILFRERLRAAHEIAETLLDLLSPQGRFALSDAMHRNILFLSEDVLAGCARALELSHNLPADIHGFNKSLRELLFLLREDLSLPAISGEILRPILEQAVKSPRQVKGEIQKQSRQAPDESGH